VPMVVVIIFACTGYRFGRNLTIEERVRAVQRRRTFRSFANSQSGRHAINVSMPTILPSNVRVIRVIVDEIIIYTRRRALSA